ncbi:hypothetical protein EVA_06607 [gut metagenome]|uniref:Uncharacterized protein n=1 Tax=gut metagenome TaxID=749906 RepID=J9GD66_9ZZZZ
MQSLVQSTVHLAVITDGLTGRFHFRREVSIQAAQLGEGECGDLNVPAFFLSGIDFSDTLFLERNA